MPYALVGIAPDDGFGDTECDSGDYRVTFERCLEEFGWEHKKALAGTFRDGRYHGIGIGCFIEGGASGPRESARVEVAPDGKVMSMSGRRRSAKASKPSWRRSRPMRSKSRWTTCACCTARPII